jgi:hypothetical protein
MTPLLAGRLQTRIFLAVTIGVLWTAIITPALPVPVGMGVGTAYRVTFESLGLMTFIGLFWELVYHLLQQTRWDKDWPSLLGLITVVNEAIPLWFVDHGLSVIPGTVGLSSPIIPLFVIHVSTTWVLTWLFMQGPLRVLHVRWRFEGGRMLAFAPGRRRRRDDWLDLVWLADLRAETGGATGPIGPVAAAGVENLPEDLVNGVCCPDGHFSRAGARYCGVCGHALAAVAPPLQAGHRPPVGVLILADGRTKVLENDLAVVAEPSGALRFHPHADEVEHLVGEIRLVGWQPVLSCQDRELTATLPGGSTLRVGSNVPVPLVPGMELVLAGELVRYESPHQSVVPAAGVPRPTDPVRPAARDAATVVAAGVGTTAGSRKTASRPGPSAPARRRTTKRRKAAVVTSGTVFGAIVTLGLIAALTALGGWNHRPDTPVAASGDEQRSAPSTQWPFTTSEPATGTTSTPATTPAAKPARAPAGDPFAGDPFAGNPFTSRPSSGTKSGAGGPPLIPPPTTLSSPPSPTSLEPLPPTDAPKPPPTTSVSIPPPPTTPPCVLGILPLQGCVLPGL